MKKQDLKKRFNEEIDLSYVNNLTEEEIKQMEDELKEFEPLEDDDVDKDK